MGWLLALGVALLALVAGSGSPAPAVTRPTRRFTPAGGETGGGELTGDAETPPIEDAAWTAAESDFDDAVNALRTTPSMTDMDTVQALIENYARAAEALDALDPADWEPIPEDESIMARAMGHLGALGAALARIAERASATNIPAELRSLATEAAAYGSRGRAVAGEIRAKAAAIEAAGAG